MVTREKIEKYKKNLKKFIIAPIFMKLGTIIEIEEPHHMAAILDCYGCHFETKMTAKNVQKLVQTSWNWFTWKLVYWSNDDANGMLIM